MLVGVIDVAEERGAEDAEREEEAEGEAEEDGGEDGVGDDHRVHVPAAALLLELPTIRGIVLQPTVLDSPFIDSYDESIIDNRYCRYYRYFDNKNAVPMYLEDAGLHGGGDGEHQGGDHDADAETHVDLE